MNGKKLRKILSTADFVSKILLGAAALLLLATVFLIMTGIEGAGGKIYRLQSDGLSLKAGEYVSVVLKENAPVYSGDAVIYVSEEKESAGFICAGTFSAKTTESEENFLIIKTDASDVRISESSLVGAIYKKAPLMTLTVKIVSSVLFYILLIVLPGCVVVFRMIYQKKKFGLLTSEQVEKLDAAGLDPEDAELQRLISLYGDEIISELITKN